MRVLTIDVADRDTVNQRAISAMQGNDEGEFLSFPSLEQFHKLMTPRKLRAIETLQTNGPVTLRGLARLLGVDPGNLTRDIRPLKEWGVVQDTPQGLFVPYDEIRLNLVISKAA